MLKKIIFKFIVKIVSTIVFTIFTISVTKLILMEDFNILDLILCKNVEKKKLNKSRKKYILKIYMVIKK